MPFAYGNIPLMHLPTLPMLACRRYTGYLPGVAETYKRTPVAAQAEVMSPGPESFIHTRTMASPAPFPPARDPKNNLKGSPDVLWPALQTTSNRDSLKPPAEPMVLGDMRIDVFRTSHAQDYKAPFQGQERWVTDG
jgi:hypothetical protein